MPRDQMATEEQSRAATWPRVALATCTGLKTALGKSRELRAQLRGLSTGQGDKPLTYITQLVPRPQPEGGQLPGKARRSRNKGGCCLIHSKDDFLKLVQPQEQRTEPPVWLRVQGKVQQGRGFMCCPGDSRGLAQAGTQLTARPSGQEEQHWCLTVSDLRVSERERESERARERDRQ